MFSANTSQVSADQVYVEDVFSTYLYTGNGSTQTITNGIDLAGKGGLVWTKRRVNTTYGDTYHILTDTIRGANKQLYSNGTDAQATNSNMITSFNADGYSIGSDGNVNFSGSGQTYASWTFRKAPKFFDVVTYTGNGVNGRAISHSLGATPGCIIVKATNTSGLSWFVYHRSAGVNGSYPNYLYLNSTSAAQPGEVFGWNAVPTATEFFIGQFGEVNNNGTTYVAYLFAHDTTSDGIIQCGSYTGNSTNPEVTLGWEPQFVMIKSSSNASNWVMFDNMRGFTAESPSTSFSGSDAQLRPNLSNAEDATANLIRPTATGFKLEGIAANDTQYFSSYIYIAIRRGPMRTPTSGTSVFSPSSPSGSSLPTQIPTGFPVDLGIIRNRTFVDSSYFFDRLRGTTTSSVKYIKADSTAAEATGSGFGMGLDNNTGVTSNWYSSADPTISWNFRRAPSFFDVVCYTGNGTSGRTVAHNLGVVPELVIVKARSTTGDWVVLNTQGGSFSFINLTNEFATGGIQFRFGDNTSYVAPTTSTFTLGTNSAVNGSGNTYVAYLFASCPGVSKVTNFTGTGALQTINCGFASGARFVLIKRTDAAGDWYIYDSSRGISSANDPYLLLNSTAAEVTSTNWVDTDASGFKLTAAAGNNVNINGASYIALAIS